MELDDWNSFAEWAAPKGAVWVVVEMGGTPLEEFVHPRNAIYVLGSEDHGEIIVSWFGWVVCPSSVLIVC